MEGLEVNSVQVKVVPSLEFELFEQIHKGSNSSG